MSPKVLEKKINRIEKDLAFIKKLILDGAKKGVNQIDSVDNEGEYNPDFVKRVFKNLKDKRGSVVYTNKKDFRKLISK